MSRKGCEGTYLNINIDEKYIDFLKKFQEIVIESKSDEEIETALKFLVKYSFNIPNYQEIINNFLELMARYLFFDECKEFKNEIEKTFDLKPEFLEKLKRGFLNFCPIRVQYKFPSKKVSFEHVKYREPYLIARGSDGLVRIWKKLNNSYYLITEIGKEGSSGPIELYNRDYLFIANENELEIYYWKNKRLLEKIEYEDEIEDIYLYNNEVFIKLSNVAQKFTVKDNKVIPLSICKKNTFDLKERITENILLGEIIELDGHIYMLPNDIVVECPGDLTDLHFYKITPKLIDIFSKFFTLKKDENSKEWILSITNEIIENGNRLEIPFRYLLIFYLFSSYKTLRKILRECLNILVPISINPELDIYGIEKFDDYLVIAKKNNNVLSIYDKDGKLKFQTVAKSFFKDEFRQPEDDIVLKVFEDGYLLKKGKKNFYGSENWKDYIYIIKNGDEIITYKDEPIYFDYLENKELFNKVLTTPWSEKKKEEESENKNEEDKNEEDKQNNDKN